MKAEAVKAEAVKAEAVKAEAVKVRLEAEAAARASAEARAAALEEALDQAKRSLSASRAQVEGLRAATARPSVTEAGRDAQQVSRLSAQETLLLPSPPVPVTVPVSPTLSAAVCPRGSSRETAASTAAASTAAAASAANATSAEEGERRVVDRSIGGELGGELTRPIGLRSLTEALEEYHQARAARARDRARDRARGGGRQLRVPGSSAASGHATAAVVAAWRSLPGGARTASMQPYLYAVLDCRVDASPDQLRRAYRRLALRWHPDKHAHQDGRRQAEAHERFQELQAAWAVLSDETLRAVYDADCCCEDWDVQQV